MCLELPAVGAAMAAAALHTTLRAACARAARPLLARLPGLLRRAVAAREAGLVGERLVRYPLLAAAALAVYHQHAWGAAWGHVRARGVGALWRGFAPLCAAALVAEGATRTVAALARAVLGPRGGPPLLVLVAARVGVVLALQPLQLLSQHMLLTGLPLGDAVADIAASVASPLGWFAGGPAHAAALLIQSLVHFLATSYYR